MTLQRVRARLMSGCDAVGDVSPMIRRGVARIDTCRLGCIDRGEHLADLGRSEEHTSELQSLMRISYAVFCLKKKLTPTQHYNLLHVQPQCDRPTPCQPI